MVGIAGAIAASGALGAVLTNVMRVDVGTISGVSLLYLGVVTLAVAVPAARALRLDPATILRTE